MSKFTEYLNLAIKGIPHSKDILDGIVNHVQLKYNKLPEDEKAEIVRRKVICQGCPFYSLNLFKDDTEYQKLYNKKFESTRYGERFCGICGCNEDYKTSSLNANCGLESYNVSHPNNQQPLKWTKFTKENGNKT